ncbi:putative DNA-binding domain-containing protein [Roseobacter sp. EG26]|uniref:HvfC/BufC family peptide modification chaperone n=1 Tax=Roseobacter sp. EG26 TaxID=3412477 RepID=UPI003CE45B71
MTFSQAEFTVALLDPESDIPSNLTDGAGRHAGRRFSVYRNNVTVSLIRALQEAFPLVLKLLGSNTFERTARLYVAEHPPTSPLMMFYGEDFPAFLRDFKPLAHVGYLPDCAKLDLAMRRSYHAADSLAVDPAVFQGAPDQVLTRRFSLSPSSILLRSPWPLFDIWRMNMGQDGSKPRAIAQDVMIVRPDFDPQPHVLPIGAADWFERIAAGKTFGEAHEQTLKRAPDFDLARTLTFALQSGILADYEKKDR